MDPAIPHWREMMSIRVLTKAGQALLSPMAKPVVVMKVRVWKNPLMSESPRLIPLSFSLNENDMISDTATTMQT